VITLLGDVEKGPTECTVEVLVENASRKTVEVCSSFLNFVVEARKDFRQLCVSLIDSGYIVEDTKVSNIQTVTEVVQAVGDVSGLVRFLMSVPDFHARDMEFLISFKNHLDTAFVFNADAAMSLMGDEWCNFLSSLAEWTVFKGLRERAYS
jgi:hypothetical protein